MESSVHRTAGLQIVTSIGVGVLGYVLQGEEAAIAALYGGAVALIATLLLLWRMQRSERKMLLEAHQHLWLFYRSGLERFLVVCVLLALGMGPFNLVPLAVLFGFVVGQIAWVFVPLQHEKRNQSKI
jgi:F0F1-type ATP synthase assembly protein I